MIPELPVSTTAKNSLTSDSLRKMAAGHGFTPLSPEILIEQALLDNSDDDFNTWISSQNPATLRKACRCRMRGLTPQTIALSAIKNDYGLTAYLRLLKANFKAHEHLLSGAPFNHELVYEDYDNSIIENLMIASFLHRKTKYWLATLEFFKPYTEALLYVIPDNFKSQTIISIWPWSAQEIETKLNSEYRPQYLGLLPGKMLDKIAQELKQDLPQNADIRHARAASMKFFESPSYQDAIHALIKKTTQDTIVSPVDIAASYYYDEGLTNMARYLVNVLRTYNPGDIIPAKELEIYELIGMRKTSNNQHLLTDETSGLGRVHKKTRDAIFSHGEHIWKKSETDTNQTLQNILDEIKYHEWLNENYLPSFLDTQWSYSLPGEPADKKHPMHEFMKTKMPAFPGKNQSIERIMEMETTQACRPLRLISMLLQHDIGKSYTKWLASNPQALEVLPWRVNLASFLRQYTGMDWMEWRHHQTGNTLAHYILDVPSIGTAEAKVQQAEIASQVPKLKAKERVAADTALIEARRKTEQIKEAFVKKIATTVDIWKENPAPLFVANHVGQCVYDLWFSLSDKTTKENQETQVQLSILHGRYMARESHEDVRKTSSAQVSNKPRPRL